MKHVAREETEAMFTQKDVSESAMCHGYGRDNCLRKTGMRCDECAAAATVETSRIAFIGTCRACKKPSQCSAEIAERRPAKRHAVTGKLIVPSARRWRICTAGVGCHGCYGQRIMSNMVGSPEDAAIAHAKQHGEEGVIHVVVAGRGHTYKVWMSASGLLSREIL